MAALPNGEAGDKSLCLTVTQVPSPCAQPTAAITVESELRETKELGLVWFGSFFFYFSSSTQPCIAWQLL